MIRAKIGGPVIIEFGGVVIRSESWAIVEFEGGDVTAELHELKIAPGFGGAKRQKAAQQKPAKKPVSMTPMCPDEERFNDLNAMYIGNRLTAILDAMPDSYQRLISAGIRRSDISVYRRNKSRASRNKVWRIAEALGMTEGQFIAGIMPQTGFVKQTPPPGGYTNMTKPNAPAPEKPKEPEKKPDVAKKNPNAPKEKKRRMQSGKGIKIGAVLHAWMIEKAMRQKDVADLSGVYFTDVSKYVNNKHDARPFIIERFAEAFGVTPEEFLAGPTTKDNARSSGQQQEEPSGVAGMNAGELVDRWMTARGLSHEDVANAAQMDRTLLTGILLGKVMIGETLKATFARVFRVSVEEFLAGPPEDMLPDPPVGTSIEDVGRYALRTGTNG